MTQRVGLDRIVHRNPCSESWEAMPGDERVRHCGKCGQSVYNLSALTRSEAARLLSERGESVCTAFYRRPDGTLLTRRCPSSVRRAWARMAAAAAGLGLAIPAAAHPDGACPTSRASYEHEPCDTTQLEIVVTDASGAAIPGAPVMLRHAARERLTWSDYAGRALHDKIAAGVYGLKVECEGFRSFQRDGLEILEGRRHLVYVTLEVGSVGGNDSYDPSLFDRPPLRPAGALVRWVKQLWS